MKILSPIVERNLEVDISKSISKAMNLTPKKCHEEKRKTKTLQATKDMTKSVKEIESNDADVLNVLAFGKSFEQYERDRLFTFNIDTKETEKLMIKRCNKENASVIKRTKHHGHFSRYLFEKYFFLQDIQSLKPASHVNWQSMA